MKRVVIAGAGEAAVSAAFALRENGFRGEIELFSAEPHHPYERPPLSKSQSGDGTSDNRPIRTPQDFALNDITIHTGLAVTAFERDRRLAVVSDGSALAYDKALIATGATARRLAIPGAEACDYLRTLDDARHLRGLLVPGARVAVVGAGFIGLEVAACAAGRGCDVAVFEASSRILSRAVHPEIAAVIHERHVREGVKLFFRHSLEVISLSGSVRSLRFSDGFTYDADIVLIGVGSQPSTELAEISGLEVSAGVVVDGTLRTGDPDIFAAGDCCRFPLAIYDGCQVRLESWRAAQQQGLLAARNMLGENAAFNAVPWFWSDQYDLTLQVAGLIDRSTRTVRRESPKGHLLFHLDKSDRLVAASALSEGNALAKDVRLAEMLIGARKVIEPRALSRPEVSLKGLLAA
ncbi:3-phenylpropionate/trans-cinnamate dioxygenase ferredoxin reductase subunit [Neorhizobium galegae]|uniref:NAD(P)/FAD-dependent oxidoreductase n=1 Tax=Neorhizobium galegae TaxID=399 RepID=UPI0027858FE0|nr:FAD-dependent oxidoreductase [Neorhizobium galegae]MDQ0138070.1 3-phenylpropionate/trans-cinnamate dioxygenase ferredoxin reductase subunit [Neorhizobium galegae]